MDIIIVYFLKITIALNKSPSTFILNIPFCNSVKLLAIANPRPLALLFLDISPWTKPSTNRSSLILISLAQIFLKIISTQSL